METIKIVVGAIFTIIFTTMILITLSDLTSLNDNTAKVLSLYLELLFLICSFTILMIGINEL